MTKIKVRRINFAVAVIESEDLKEDKPKSWRRLTANLIKKEAHKFIDRQTTQDIFNQSQVEEIEID